MKPDTNSIYFLTQREYLVLAAMAGLDRIKGVFLEKEKNALSEEDVYYACFGLIQKGALNDNRVMQEPYRGIFDGIRKAKLQLTAHRYEEYEKRTIVIYISSERFVINSISHTDEAAICICEEECPFLLSELKDGNYLPEIIGDLRQEVDIEQKPVQGSFFWTEDDAEPLSCRDYSISVKGGIIINKIEQDERTGWMWVEQNGSDYMVRVSDDSETDYFRTDSYLQAIEKDLRVDE